MGLIKARSQAEREACELEHASRIKDKWIEHGLFRYCPVCNRGWIVCQWEEIEQADECYDQGRAAYWKNEDVSPFEFSSLKHAAWSKGWLDGWADDIKNKRNT